MGEQKDFKITSNFFFFVRILETIYRLEHSWPNHTNYINKDFFPVMCGLLSKVGKMWSTSESAEKVNRWLAIMDLFA